MNFRERFTQSFVFAILLSLLAFLYVGVQGEAIAAPFSGREASAALSDPSGKSNLSGQVTFSETPKGLQIQASVSQAPTGFHGFHIHEIGSCKDSGLAAGGHFNPDNVKHGRLATDGFKEAHAGDLGNILVASNGSGSMTQTIQGLLLTDGKYAIANRAVIVHAQKDDFSQPTGNAGGRIGCGIITLSKS